ncbi:MAG: energy-coupling factor ABC transporter ATP-binding protein, partial [Methanomicrobiales archaeon]|nr:energy-coupling factor ABC transporter ATP-binding protein [Methanomicrobiales archaeon]
MTITRRELHGLTPCPVVDPEREIIHVDCASHSYPDGSIGIHDMCFHVLKNEIVAICGPNGSGKSTLIEHLNGLLTPSQGKILVQRRLLSGIESSNLWRVVGVVFQQSDDQLFAPTVLDDVMFGLLNLGLNRKEAKERAMHALEAVGGAHLARKIPNYLSGGEKRLVAIAGILAMRPQVIALDEPTSDLDPVHSGRIERLIMGLKEEFGIGVVVATHDLDFAARIADRICLVKNGSVFAEGPPAEVFYDPDLIR